MWTIISGILGIAGFFDIFNKSNSIFHFPQSKFGNYNA